MKDKFYTLLVFAGLVILILIAVDSNKDKRFNSFDAMNFYEPTERGAVMNSAALYDAISAGRSASCPQTKMDIATIPDAINLIGRTFNTVSDSKYGVVTFPISAQGLGISVYTIPNKVDSYPGNIEEVNKPMYEACAKLSLNYDEAVKTGPVTINDLRSASQCKSKFFKLIAPFSFNFANVNTMENSSISIVNVAGTMMITFNNVANWYCAGGIEEDSTSQSSTNDITRDTTKWENHEHNSIIGNSANAIVTGGSQGAVFGYATGETSIEVKVWDKESSTFVPASICELFAIGSQY